MAFKDYNLWHKLKTWLHNEKPRVFFHEREIWFCFLGSNIGFEQDGHGDKFLRPVIIVKKFNNEIFLGAPLSETDKKGIYYFHFSFTQGVKSNAILSQIRLLDAKRLKYKAGDISVGDFAELKDKLRQLLA